MANDDFQEMVNEMKKDKQGNKKFWSPPSDKEGTFPIRFLPHVKENGEKVFYLHHRVHWVNGSSYECLKQRLVDKNGVLHEPEDCPICNFSSQLFSTSVKDTDDYNLAYDLSAKDRYVYRIVVRGKSNEREPEFFESGKKLFGVIYHILTETDYGNICDLKEGRDFNLVKTGTKRRSNYDTSLPSANVAPAFKTIEELKELISNFKKMVFTQLVEFSSYDTMKSALTSYINGGKSKSTDEPPAQSAKPALAKQSSPAVEEPEESKSEDELDSLLAEFTA